MCEAPCLPVVLLVPLYQAALELQGDRAVLLFEQTRLPFHYCRLLLDNSCTGRTDLALPSVPEPLDRELHGRVSCGVVNLRLQLTGLLLRDPSAECTAVSAYRSQRGNWLVAAQRASSPKTHGTYKVASVTKPHRHTVPHLPACKQMTHRSPADLG